ncbi:hypothetical protein HGRIS_002807 [Hohenbuehelia grisea]|uniref:Uncharacterized protein n=1 Tax=Hohenbuehelia grisea TaxID=104357 RepID=A0ABR3JM52_9AGAR
MTPVKPLGAAALLIQFSVVPCAKAAFLDVKLGARQDDQHGDSDSDSDTDSDSQGPGNTPRSSSVRSFSRSHTATQPSRTPGASNTRSSSPAVSSTGSSDPNALDNRTNGGPGTGGIIGIVVALIIVAALALFGFFAWRRRARQARSRPRGTVFLSSFTDSPRNGSHAYAATSDSAPEMPLASLPSPAASRRTHSVSVSESASPLLAPVAPLPSPYERQADYHRDHQAAGDASLSRNPSTSRTNNIQPYSYEESQSHASSSPTSPRTAPSAFIPIPSLVQNTLARDSPAARTLDSEPLGLASAANSSATTNRRESQLHRDMAAYQKQLEADDKRKVNAGGGGAGSTHPSGDSVVALVDPPPVYSRALS